MGPVIEMVSGGSVWFLFGNRSLFGNVATIAKFGFFGGSLGSRSSKEVNYGDSTWKMWIIMDLRKICGSNIRNVVSNLKM